MQHTPYFTGYMKLMENGNTKRYLVILDDENNGKVVVSVAQSLLECQKRRISGTSQVGYAKQFLDYIYIYCDGLKDIAQVNLEQLRDFGLHPKIRTIVTQNLRFENTKPGQEQAVPFDGLCSPASSAYG